MGMVVGISCHVVFCSNFFILPCTSLVTKDDLMWMADDQDSSPGSPMRV